MEKWPNFENLPQGTEKPVTFLIFKPVSQFILVGQSVQRKSSNQGVAGLDPDDTIFLKSFSS